jgi:small-conductance mechanosensitive channel
MRIATVGLISAALLLSGLNWPSRADERVEPPPQVQELVKLLDDPAVRAWLDRARTTGEPPPPGLDDDSAASTGLALRLAGVREHLRTVGAAVPLLPGEFARAADLLVQEMSDRGIVGILLLIAAFAALGYGSEHLFWRATARARAWIDRHPMTTLVDRLRLVGMRFGFGLILVTIFGLGSIGAFLIFDWPPLLRQVVLAYLVAVLIVRLTLVVGRVVLAPGRPGLDPPDRYRLIPMDIRHARFWQRRLAWFVGYFAVGWATVGLMGVLGFPPPLRAAAAYLLGLGLLAIGLEAVWRRPRPETAEAQPRIGRTPMSVLLSAYGVMLWLLWVAGLSGMFWLAAVMLLLPAAIAIARKAVAHLLRPTEGGEWAGHGVLEVCIERGIRAVLIASAALWLAHVWTIDLVALTDRDTLLTRLLRGGLTSVVILLLADFAWQVIKAAVDAKLIETQGPAEPGTEQAVRQSRLRTLLPIFRNILFVVIAVLAGLTALSALGVEIGPLIAGAGVVGVAVGFGAQTLVKDVIGGIFYLLDDAFRVGEYIQSGSYKGTVESFSLRSVRLRHHRGPVYTVPFGQLGAVQNMSRDWVIDKFQIGVTYDTDLEKARKLIKTIGQELAADPEFGQHIIEPLKLQGVEQFGDYAIQIRFKMTTRPGEQFVIRRKAFARIKQAFDENGIKFAFPTVQVAGGGEDAPIAAHESLQLVKPAGAAEQALREPSVIRPT